MPSKNSWVRIVSCGGAKFFFALVAMLFLYGSSAKSAPAAPAVPFREDRILIIPKAGREAQLENQHAAERVKIRKKFPALGNIHALEVPRGTDPQALVERYRRSGHVEAAELDYADWRPAASPNDPSFLNGIQWHLNNTGQFGGTPDADIDAPEAWDLQHSATNIIVAVIDTGVRVTHEDIAPNLWTNTGETGLDGMGNDKRTNGIDDDGNGFIDDVHGMNAGNNTGDLTDDCGSHGTHVAGIVCAAGNNGVGVSGVAWKVQLMPLKVLTGCSGSDSDFIMCLDYARARGAKVINCSIVSSMSTTMLSNAFWNVRNADIVVCAAAGNNNVNIDSFPIYPPSYKLDNMLGVMATTRNDVFSYNWGPNTLHLAAPGLDIYSTGAGSDTDYFFNHGTSMASPMVAGAAALVRARFTNETAQQVIQRILNGVDVIPSLAGRCKTGGRLNLRKAVDAASLPLFGYTNAPYHWVPTNGMAPLTFATSEADNGPLALPFVFPLYGRTYTQIWVGANGLLGVTNTGLTLAVNSNLPLTNNPNAIYPYWDDLNPLAGGRVWWGTVGIAPNRKAVVTWDAVPHMTGGGGPFTFQAILHESGHVAFQYQQVELGNASQQKGKAATVGIEEITGLFATRHGFNGVPNQVSNSLALVFTSQVVNHPAPGLQLQSVPPDQIQLTISGEPRHPGAILCSTNLTSWSMVYSNLLPASGLAAFTETNSSPQRFYRAVSGPFTP